MKTGIKLKMLREKKRFSQEALAYKIGVAQATIGNWERGKSIKHEYIPKLAVALEVTMDYFFEEKQKVFHQPTVDTRLNNDLGFEITIKTPNNLFEDITHKLNKVIGILDKDKI